MTSGMASTLADDIRACIRFYSRLPVSPGGDGYAMPDFARASRATPLAGAAIGAIGALALIVAKILHLPPLISATCAVGALIVATGALHEDGLADVADGFGGGATREQKLSIMRDSRLGTYGATALFLSALLRISSLAEISQHSLWLAVLSVISAAALSRAVGLIPLVTLLPARGDGAGASAATPSPSALRIALCFGAVIAVSPLFGGATLAQIVVAQMAAVGGALVVSKMAERQIGGYTGDVLGAAQQAAEIGVLITLAAS